MTSFFWFPCPWWSPPKHIQHSKDYYRNNQKGFDHLYKFSKESVKRMCKVLWCNNIPEEYTNGKKNNICPHKPIAVREVKSKELSHIYRFQGLSTFDYITQIPPCQIQVLNNLNEKNLEKLPISLARSFLVSFFLFFDDCLLFPYEYIVSHI